MAACPACKEPLPSPPGTHCPHCGTALAAPHTPAPEQPGPSAPPSAPFTTTAPNDDTSPKTLTPQTVAYIGLICALAAGALGYRLLIKHHLQQSAALFIGLPTLIGVLIALTPRPKSITGTILKAMVLVLALSGPLFGEGFICVLFAAPLLLVVGLIVGLTVDGLAARRKKREAKAGTLETLKRILPIPVLFAMSLEGTTPGLSFARHEAVRVSRIIPAPAHDVERALADAPRFTIAPTGILGIGFPIPLHGTGSDLAVGEKRIVHFSEGEGRPPGDLALAITERREGYVRFDALSDSSHLRHWLHWSGSEVQWQPASPDSTTVTWTIHYERGLDPAWYFGWAQRAVVTRCADYLITSCATPKP